MGQPAKIIREGPEDGLAAVSAAFAADVQRRVEDIRNGAGHWPEVEELLAEMERYEDEDLADDDEDGDDVDSAEVEAAWAVEIQRRVEEIRSGTVRMHAAENVIAAMRLRFG